MILTSCTTQKEAHVVPKNVGDIAFDKSIDSPDFMPCNENFIGQYFFTPIENDVRKTRFKIDSFFFVNYKNIPLKKESGLIRIRFIVNCKGEAGRFRMLQADTMFKEKKFDTRITKQLMQLIKKIDFWEISKAGKSRFDYYYYLIFKIENGSLKEILP